MTFERSVLASPEMRARAGAAPSASITTLHQLLVGRGPDPAGLAYWTSRLEAGRPPRAVVDGLLGSVESRRHRVTQAYQEVAGRPPSTAERAISVDLLAATRDIRLVAVVAMAAHGVEGP